MAEGSVETTVAAPADQVWAVVGDFAAAGDLFPGLESFRMEGDDRIIGMFGLEIREHLIARDDAARSISYSVVDGVPLEHHRATMTVVADGPGAKVTWAFDVEPESMAPIFADTYTKALEVLVARFA